MCAGYEAGGALTEGLGDGLGHNQALNRNRFGNLSDGSEYRHLTMK